MSIKLISLNIEGGQHLKNRIFPFIKSENPDVVCFQEVFERDVELIKKTLKMTGIFVPLGLMSYDKKIQVTKDSAWGLLCLSKIPILGSGYEYYYGDESFLPTFYPGLNPNVINRAIGWLQLSSHGQIYEIVNTHFTWSYVGEISELQKQTLKSMYQCLSRFKNIVLTGDFNTPRGDRLFSDISSRYLDNIPKDIQTTIDNNLHRASEKIQFVVDGVFSSPKYSVTRVSLKNGVSDHFAIISQVDINNYPSQLASIGKIILNRCLFLMLKIPRWLKYKLKKIKF